jgi:son of sevenless-like protein
MAQGYVQDEDYESEANSASELDGESIMLASASSLVCLALAVLL